MNKINLKNYEAYFLDFSEGNLSPTEMEDLRNFLTQHPHLKIELEEFEQPLLATEIPFNHNLKAQLYREESTGLPMVDYLMVAQVEETISPNEKRQLAKSINNNEAILNDLAIYHKTKLTADKKFLYPDKKALLRKENKFAFWAKAISVAAAAALFFGLLNIEFADEQYRPIQFSYSAVQTDDQSTESVQQQLIPQEGKIVAAKIKSTELPKPIANNSTLAEKRSKISKIPVLLFQSIESVASHSETLEKSVKKVELMPLSFNDSELLAQDDEPKNQEFPTLTKLASQKIKTDVLKSKSLKEAIIDELAELSDNRLSLAEKQVGKTQRFAINIGKFSYSNF